MNTDAKFWAAIDSLVNTSQIVIDRPKGSTHPKYSNFVYKVDYGYKKIHHLWMAEELMSGKAQTSLPAWTQLCVSLI